MINRVGEALFSIGGIMMVAGLFLARFPRSVAWFGRLPGDIMTERVFAPLTSMIVISIVLSLLASIFGGILRALK